MRKRIFTAVIALFLIGCTEHKLTKTQVVESAEIEVTPEVTPEVDTDFIQFEATAYCDMGITFSEVYVQRGIVAGDPRVLPIGSVIEVQAGRYSGVFVVLDTGRLIKGHILDIWLPEYEEAIQFGRQQVKVKVIRYGWNPEYQMTSK